MKLENMTEQEAIDYISLVDKTKENELPVIESVIEEDVNGEEES
jgi:hypothetical protein